MTAVRPVAFKSHHCSENLADEHMNERGHTFTIATTTTVALFFISPVMEVQQIINIKERSGQSCALIVVRLLSHQKYNFSHTDERMSN